MHRFIATTARNGAAVAATIAAAQILPAATRIPPVRRLAPGLLGQGRGDHVALTFDDGPDPTSTPQLLALLEELRVQATFFLLGSRLSAAPGLGQDIARGGHEVAVHGWTHENLLARGPRSILRDLRRTTALVCDTTSRQPTWFRPPYGVLSGSALVAARRAGLRPILWSAWGRDWDETADKSSIAATVLGGLSAGGTILLHESPVGGAAQSDARIRAALPTLIDTCRSSGLRVGPLAEHW